MEMEAGHPIGEPCLATCTKEAAEEGDNGAQAYVRGDGESEIAVKSRGCGVRAASASIAVSKAEWSGMHGSFVEGREEER
jgi:hypothetical protein